MLILSIIVLQIEYLCYIPLENELEIRQKIIEKL